MQASAIRVFPVRYCFLICTFITMTTGVPPSPLAAQTPAPAILISHPLPLPGRMIRISPREQQPAPEAKHVYPFPTEAQQTCCASVFL